MIEAGKLRELISIEEKNLVDNNRGGRTRPAGGPEWITMAEDVFAEVIPLRGDEALNNAVVRAVQLYRVTIRARDDVTTSHVINWGGTRMDIKAKALSTDRADLVMTCEAGRAS